MKLMQRRRESGATVVEMAIIAPVFLLVLLGLIEFSLIFFATLTMQYAVREGARFAVTGQTSLDAATASQRYTAIIQNIKNNSLGFYDKVSPVISVNGTSYATSTSYTSGMFGKAGDLIVLQLDCDWVVTTPFIAALYTNGKYHFKVAATMRNEAFP
jgi:Flp pilus assembly protein TadG